MKIKEIYFSIIAISITFTISSCSNYNNGYKTDNTKASYIKTAQEKYSNNISYKFSPDSNYVICYRTETQAEANGTPQLRFFIYDLKNNKITYEDNSRSESILWINNSKLKVTKIPGMITNDEQKNINLMGYIYDLSQNKKLPLSKPTNNKLK